MLRFSAFSGSAACEKYRQRYATPSATTNHDSSRECSSHCPGVRILPSEFGIRNSPRSMPRSFAVRLRPAGGVAKYITPTTTTISTATATKLCHRKIVWRNGIRPPATIPPCATMSRICGCSAPGVAICSAAEPLSPCAQMLPSPSMLAAASAR